MNYYKPTKKPLPESAELKQQKREAGKILSKAFKEVREMGLYTVVFDSTYGESISAANISIISKEESDHGVWVA